MPAADECPRHRDADPTMIRAQVLDRTTRAVDNPAARPARDHRPPN